MSTVRFGIFIVGLVTLFGFASALPPTAAFNGTPLSGTAPLTVSFTDQSTGSPTGWAWYFGDESYSQAWTQVTANAGWSERYGHTSVTMPDGSIVLMGGNYLNDVWRSTDDGATWTQMTAHASWSGRWGHSSVVMPDGSIVLMGGEGGDTAVINDVWRSTDDGATWTQMTANAGWSAREEHCSVVMPDGSIVLMGGSSLNDVWRSMDAGATWTQMTAHASWSGRRGHSSVVMPDGSIVLMGGIDIDSTNDVWRSTDYGATWTEINSNAGWSARGIFSSVVMPDGSIVLMGGKLSGGTSVINDVWRLVPASSSAQNPSHTYTPGTYQVSLQVYNTDGYNSTRKAGYITVNALAPVANFTGTPTYGIAPLTVIFTDSSTNFPASWNWSFGDGTTSASRNPEHIYTSAGTYTVSLNVTNAGGTNTKTSSGYITANVPPAPVADFTGTPTYGTVPLMVTFTDHSTNSPTLWNWSFGDGTTSTSRNSVHIYTIAGTYTVTLNATNAGGSNTKTAVGYITANVPPATVGYFTGTPTSGQAPLNVSFTDLSTNSPTGWAWYFGDESYSQAWTQVTANAGWSGRFHHTSVTMPDGSIVLMGGNYKNDVWRSTDDGATWTQMTANAGWSERYGHTSVTMPDGSIVLMGGNYLNDVWRSTDDGATWTQMTANAGWPVRSRHSSVVMPDGSIVLMGGEGGDTVGINDVWRSTDYGATWTQMTANAGWSERSYHSSVVTPDGSIVLMGGIDNSGNYKNDVWLSTDDGATWTQMTASAGWTARRCHSSVAMPDGSIVLMGGIGIDCTNDVWRSTDYGATWTEINSNAGWSARGSFSSVVMPDGSIVLMGGKLSGGTSVINDVWRLMPASSSAQNPSHTYTSPGTYQVSLQAYNASGYDSTRKAGYVTVNNEDYGESYEPPSPSTLSAIDRTITETVNVGGGSAVTLAEMTGSDLGKNLVITAFPRKSLPSGMVTPNTTVYQYISIVSSTIPGVV
ncbi:MAG: PKD domain-containing protein, partial [Methanoregula sp.]|nr:PKD domain-containing protein [Methanoregula sp.]